jgi:uncharacterized protein (DUF1778 family)
MYCLNVYIIIEESLPCRESRWKTTAGCPCGFGPKKKALLLRALALDHTDLTNFVLRHALFAAKAVIQEADNVQLSGRDSLRVLDLLENPPAPNTKLLAAAGVLPKRRS